MPKERKIGTGITRHRVTLYDGLDPKDMDQWLSDTKGYVSPTQDFPSWLAKYEAELADMAKKQRLPTRANVMVIYDAANRSDWYEADEDEWRKVAMDLSYRRKHRFKQPKATPARFYLTATDNDPAVESSWGWQWGYQSVRWYLGTLMGLVQDCRRALEKQAWLELAGRCINLGEMRREFQLKFASDKKVQEFQKASERQVKGVDRANAGRKARAATWQAKAMQIADRMPMWDRASASAVAVFVLANWGDGKPPSKVSLRKHVAASWSNLKRDQT